MVQAAAFAYRHVKQAKTLASLPVIKREVRSAVAATQPGTAHAAEAALRTAFSGVHGAIRPFQNFSEIRGLLDLLVTRKPKRLLEIGTANGGTLFLFCRVADPEAEIISVDLPGGWFGGGYPRWKAALYRRFASPGQKLHLIRADSHSKETFSFVKAMLAGERFDFIFIDGDHTYEGVAQDYEHYRNLLAPNGIIGFHDIVPNATDPDCQVPRFWKALQKQKKTTEYVESQSQPGAGIGIILPSV